MAKDNRKKEERQKFKDEYYKKILGEPGESLLKDDKAAQKKILKQEGERLTRLVAKESSSKAVTGDCTKLLTEARENLEKDDPEMNKVLGYFDGVRQRLLRAYDSREAQPNFFPLIAGYNLVWFIGLVGIIVIYQLVPGQERLVDTAWVCLACALWGGVGGVVDAYFALHTHFADQDFDRRYWPWYYFHPLLGLSMGAVVFLILQAGLLAVSGVPLQEAAAANAAAASLQDTVTANITAVSNEAEGISKIGVTALPIVIAFLAGFRQRTAVKFFTRIIKSIFEKE